MGKLSLDHNTFQELVGFHLSQVQRVTVLTLERVLRERWRDTGFPVHKGPQRKKSFPEFSYLGTEATTIVQVGSRLWHHPHDNNFVDMQNVRVVKSWNLLSQFQKKMNSKMDCCLGCYNADTKQQSLTAESPWDANVQCCGSKAGDAEEVEVARNVRHLPRKITGNQRCQTRREWAEHRSGRQSYLSPWELASYLHLPQMSDTEAHDLMFVLCGFGLA